MVLPMVGSTIRAIAQFFTRDYSGLLSLIGVTIFLVGALTDEIEWENKRLALGATLFCFGTILHYASVPFYRDYETKWHFNEDFVVFLLFSVLFYGAMTWLLSLL